MLPNIGYMLLAMCALASLALTSTSVSASSAVGVQSPYEEYRECASIDIRNNCNNMHKLDNCTVINGFMMITLLPVSTEKCNYSLYSFPKLREVTGYVIFTDVRGLVSIRHMFPNLTVIRGRRLFLNYALGVTAMPNLELLEFPSLVAIQRGHVYIGNNPKLCQLNNLNLDRITLSQGSNHVVPTAINCTNLVGCNGCPSSYCWSNFTCQRFQNDNVAHIDRGTHTCHEECLGGCFNETAAGCMVCRGITNAGVCVKQCPPDKYLLEYHQRCYTREQCAAMKHFTYNGDCVAFCPSGYKANTSSACVPCAATEPCISVCSPDPSDEVIVIYNLGDAEELKGCQIVNSSLYISIRNNVHEERLMESLSSIREIRGHLKIFRTSLTSFKFLENLQRIHGDPLENNHYGIIIYDNNELTELWEPKVRLELVKGGIFMHRNNKLCNMHMKEFQRLVSYDKVLESLQTNDQDVLCGPSKLQLNVQILSHRTILLIWPKAQKSVELELIYRIVAEGQTAMEELDAPICTRINWQRMLLFEDDLQKNDTHYTYQLDQLQSNTRYACLLRTFGGEIKDEARSEVIYVQTQRDIPKAPSLAIGKSMESVMNLRMSAQDHDYYVLNVYELPDDKAYLEQRDFCKQETVLWQDMDRQYSYSAQEYDECCAHHAEQTEDQHFIDEMKAQYRCSLDAPNNCADIADKKQPQQQLRLAPNKTQYELRNLKRYRLYSLELQACNQFGCSTPTTLNERTNYSLTADLPSTLSACRVPGSNQYIVRFDEPTQSNGIINSYVVHYKSNGSYHGNESHIYCLTRRDHADANYVLSRTLENTYIECAVRVQSMAGSSLSSYVAITLCDKQQSQLPSTTMKTTTTTTTTTPTTTTSTSTTTATTATEGRSSHVETVTPVTELVETHSHAHGISIFVICFLFGCGLSLVWLLYKRRCWRKWPGLRRYVPLREQWLRERHQPEDREILVDGFETVRFQNNNNSNSNGNNSINNNSNSSNEY
ncbi:insulin receptor [Drosophila albomicans]|uniref:receptor protein-tyrosine kinase n=1 Tax=Drosophila albomicans TaxID=7291 RepID=A0A9C6SNT5_DROAB|nr:insulin receptor [Drosophila albomicans]